MKSTWLFAIGALLVCLVLAAAVSPFASKAPDGLEKVASDEGFAHKEKPGLAHALIPDYVVRGVGSESLATALAGLIGALAAFGAALLLARVIVRRKGAGPPQEGAS
jgi:cobalt/nickel transport protein